VGVVRLKREYFVCGSDRLDQNRLIRLGNSGDHGSSLDGTEVHVLAIARSATAAAAKRLMVLFL
jgi:hypothetical protein